MNTPEPFFFNGRSSELYVLLTPNEAERFKAFAEAKDINVKIESSASFSGTTEKALVEFPLKMSLLAVEMLLAEFFPVKKESSPSSHRE